MENKTVNRLGQLYKLLCIALGEGSDKPVNQADLDNASRYPVRQVSMKIAMAHKLHKMAPSLDLACTNVLKDVTEQDMEDSFNLKAISIQQQGIFMTGYMTSNISLLCTNLEAIKKARENAGYTIRGLAEVCGVSPSTIQNAENGTTIPKIETLNKIAKACRVSMADLMPQ